MNILGIGTDIIEVLRVEKAYHRQGQNFLDRLFTEDEQAYCLARKTASSCLAARFAAKEAVSKALGTGFGEDLSWLDIEIKHNLSGKPEVYLSNQANIRFDTPTILLSISHCKEYATATALVIKS